MDLKNAEEALEMHLKKIQERNQKDKHIARVTQIKNGESNEEINGSRYLLKMYL